jgi:hypothetical protein
MLILAAQGRYIAWAGSTPEFYAARSCRPNAHLGESETRSPRIQRTTPTEHQLTGETIMTKTNPWVERLALAAVAFVIGAGALESVAGAMKHPDAAAVAQRRQALQATFDRVEINRRAAEGISVAEPHIGRTTGAQPRG